VLNSVFAQRARELFRVPQSYISVVAPGQGLAQELVEDGHARILFDGPHDAERWDVRVRRDEVVVERWQFAEQPERAEGEKPPAIGELFVILAAQRGSAVTPMYEAREWKPDDVALVAIHTDDENSAREVLRARGFVPAESVEKAGATDA
jgi:hypothetical protein